MVYQLQANSLMRTVVSILVLCLAAAGGRAATLEKLTLDDMTARSTAIVRARAVSSSARFVGSTIYTETHFQVLETWKGPNAAEIVVSEPGGTVGAVTQNYAGVPRFTAGEEQVLFLWTGPSGRTQVMGLTQGIFQVQGAGAAAMARQERSSSVVLAPGSGTPVQAQETSMALSALASRVRSVVGPLPK